MTSLRTCLMKSDGMSVDSGVEDVDPVEKIVLDLSELRNNSSYIRDAFRLDVWIWKTCSESVQCARAVQGDVADGMDGSQRL